MIQHPTRRRQSEFIGIELWRAGLARCRRAPVPAAMAVLTIAGLWTLLGGCSTPQPKPEPASEVTELPIRSFGAQWRAELPLEGAQLRKLVAIDDKVFAADSTNRCYWLTRSGGTTLAVPEVARPVDVLFDPVVMGKEVIFPSTTRLTVYDDKGKFLYRLPLRYGASSGAVAANGLLYIGIDHPVGSRVSAIELKEQPYDISPVWELMTHGAVSGTPALYQGQLFVGSRDGGVYGVRAGSRTVLWPTLDLGYYKTDGPIIADVKADKDGVYAASMDGKLYCLDINTGRLRWAYHAGQPLRDDSAPVPMGSTVYIYVPGTGVVAIDNTGRQEIRKPKWAVAEARQFLSSDDKYVYLRSAEDTILAVEKQSGSVQFRSRRGDLRVFAVNTSPKDNLIFAGTPEGVVLAIKPVLKAGSMGEIVLDTRATNATGF